jgi:hypothetical protein
MTLALAACARVETPPAPSASAHAARAGASHADAPARSAEVAPVSDGVLVDAQGRRYRLVALPKTQAVRLDASTVRSVWGVPLDVVREDADAYYYKRYEVSTAPARPASTPACSRRAEAGAAAERVTIPRSDRLRFRTFGKGLPTAGQWRDGFAIADVNGDGHPDLVHGPARKSLGGPVVFLGDGHGSWRRWTEAQFPARAYGYGDAQAGDVNGDGRVDLVFAVHLRGLIALLGDGAGGFTDASEGLDFAASADAGGFSSRAIRLVDWDGDGRPDVLALGEGPRLVPGRGVASADGVVAYLNRGGRWERRADRGPAARVFGQALATGDFDGDGHLDVATGSGILGRTDLVHLGTGDGGWTTVDVPVPPRSYVRALAARDFDADGRADLVVGYLARVGEGWRTGIDVLYPRAGGRWDHRGLFAAPGREGVFALAAGDLDGDGRGDVVALDGAGDTLVFLGDGHGFFTREAAHIPRFPGGCQGSHVELADLDGDGRDEVVASFAQEHSSVAAATVCPSGGGITAWRAR